MVGVEHDALAAGFALEQAGSQPRQQQRTETSVDDVEIGDRGVQSEVVGVGLVARGDGVLGRAIDLDVALRIALEDADERP